MYMKARKVKFSYILKMYTSLSHCIDQLILVLIEGYDKSGAHGNCSQRQDSLQIQFTVSLNKIINKKRCHIEIALNSYSWQVEFTMYHPNDVRPSNNYYVSSNQMSINNFNKRGNYQPFLVAFGLVRVREGNRAQ